MDIRVKCVADHYAVFVGGEFYCSADTREEAEAEAQDAINTGLSV